MPPVTLSDKAIEEFEDAYDFLNNQREGLGYQFAIDVDNTFDAIQRTPQGYQVIEHPYRRKPLSKFAYNVYYRVEEDHIYIISIKHQAAHPDSWKR